MLEEQRFFIERQVATLEHLGTFTEAQAAEQGTFMERRDMTLEKLEGDLVG